MDLLSPDDICTSPDDCKPPSKGSHFHSGEPDNISSNISLLFSSLTFLGVFLLIIGILTGKKVFAKICIGGIFGSSSSLPGNYGIRSSSHDCTIVRRMRTSRRIGEATFVVTLGSTAVLAFLILCEVSNWFNSHSRQLGFNVTVNILLLSLVFLIPVLQIHQILDSLKIARYLKHGRRGKKYFYLTECGLFMGWLWCFWEVGSWIPEISKSGNEEYWRRFTARSLSEGCLSRLGLIGVSLMAVLSGFGAVSAPCQSFGKKPRGVTETDVNRVQAGLDATTELLDAKRARKRSVEAKVKEKKTNQSGGIITRVFTAVRSDAEAHELALLQIEINGLETMHTSLFSSLSSLRSRHASSTGSRCLVPVYITSTLFSLYCIYRIITTTIAHFPLGPGVMVSRFHKSPDQIPPVSPGTEAAAIGRSPTNRQFVPSRFSSSKSDPINNILAILARYWDSQLDREGWSRFISFILSGVIIFGSIRSVVITIEVLTRKVFAPFLLPPSSSPPLPAVEESPDGQMHLHGNQILALGISQITGTYVLASALLLRSNLPPEMSSAITNALGAPALDPKFIEWWFDGIFLWSVLASGIGFYIGRRWRIAGLGGACGIDEDEWWEDNDVGLDDYVQVSKAV